MILQVKLQQVHIKNQMQHVQMQPYIIINVLDVMNHQKIILMQRIQVEVQKDILGVVIHGQNQGQ